MSNALKFQIDDNIPLPKIEGRGARTIYPLTDLKIGQSFFVQNKKIGNFASTTQAAEKRSGMKFALRSVTENGVAGVRVWRTE